VSQRPAGRAIAAFVVHLVMTSLVFALVLALGVGATMLVRWAVPLELASSSPQKALEASMRILELHERFWPVAFASLAGVALAAGWLGRRITGPLVRIGQGYARIAAGELPEPVAIRAGDYLREQVAEFNAMLAALAKRAEKRERALDELREHAAKSDDEELASLVARALERVRAIDEPAG
jgi:methyl-accepting chemotaxis protein